MASKKARIIKYRVVVRKIELCTDSLQKARIICGMKNCTVPLKIAEFAQDFAESVLGVSIFFDETEARLTKMFRFFQKNVDARRMRACASSRSSMPWNPFTSLESTPQYPHTCRKSSVQIQVP